jgi:hypothetical protein
LVAPALEELIARAQRQPNVQAEQALVEKGKSVEHAPRPDAKSASLLAAIDDAIREAIEEGDPRPSEAAIGAARKLAGEIARLGIASPTVNITRDSEIEFDFRGKTTRSGVLLICEPEGSGLCIFDIAGSPGRQRYANARDMLALGGQAPLARLAEV